MKKLNYYWFSFSLKGKNQGCCNVEAKDEKIALQKTIDLKIHPKHDDIFCCLIEKIEVPLDKLFPSEYLNSKGYEKFKGTQEEFEEHLEKHLNNE